MTDQTKLKTCMEEEQKAKEKFATKVGLCRNFIITTAIVGVFLSLSRCFSAMFISTIPQIPTVYEGFYIVLAIATIVIYIQQKKAEKLYSQTIKETDNATKDSLQNFINSGLAIKEKYNNEFMRSEETKGRILN